jgi:hypothetical protein
MTTSTERPDEDQRRARQAQRSQARWTFLAMILFAGLLLIAGGVGGAYLFHSGSSSKPASSTATAPTAPQPSMPDLFGMRVSEATSFAGSMGISLKTYGQGDGLITGQEIAPGQPVDITEQVDLYTTDMPANLHPSTISHQTLHAGVNLDAPMSGPYDATYKSAAKIWLSDKNGSRARAFCSTTNGIMMDTAQKIRDLLGPSSPKYQELVQNTAQAQVACRDVDARYSSGRWPGIPS